MPNRTENNRGWSTNVAPEGATVSQKSGGTHDNHDSDDEFAALFSWNEPRRRGLPSDIVEYLEDVTVGPSIYEFVDRSNPFYPRRLNMYAVKRHDAERVVEIIESLGYECEAKLEQSQFKFIPRPTVGEVIVYDTNATQ